MAQPPPATIGMPLAEVDTPALLIDLDAFERNLQRMADFVRSAGVRLRPHSKTHKSPDHRRAADRARRGRRVLPEGVGGRGDGGGRRRRRARLQRGGGRGQARPPGARWRAGPGSACASTMPTTSPRSRRRRRKAGASIDVLVEIDVGGRRCGIAPGAPAARLAERIARSPHLRFAGLQAYHGSAQHVREAARAQARRSRARWST